MAGLAFDTIFRDNMWTGIGYRSPESGQNELVVTFASTQENNWQTAYTVPEGMTLYITDIMLYSVAGEVFVGYGATPAVIWHAGVADLPHQVSFRLVPLKLNAGEIIQFKGSATDGGEMFFLGWLE